MKKLSLMLFSAVAMIAVAACSSYSTEDVNEKISEGLALSENDYKIMIDYLGRFAEEAQPIQDALDNAAEDSAEAMSKTMELKELGREYPYVETFGEALAKASKAQLSPDNIKDAEKYSDYVWFPSLDWESDHTDAYGGPDL